MNLNVQWQEQNPDLWVCFLFKDKALFSFGHLLIATGDGDGGGDVSGVQRALGWGDVSDVQRALGWGEGCDVSGVQRALNA